jgi:hypothetical protein
MLFLGLLLLLVFDTIIRHDDESKLKKFWIKKFPTPRIQKVDNILNNIRIKMTKKMTENKNLPNRHIDFQPYIISLTEIITMIPSKYATRFFWIGLSLFLLSCFQIIYSIISLFI